MGMEEPVGLFVLPWSNRKKGGPWLIAEAGWSLCSIVSNGNYLMSVICRVEKIYFAHTWPSVFYISQHCLFLYSWTLKSDM